MTPSDICIVTVRDEPGVRFGNPLPAIYDFESEINAPEIPAPTEVYYDRGMAKVFMISQAGKIQVDGGVKRKYESRKGSQRASKPLKQIPTAWGVKNSLKQGG